jgi:hypothetical protein
MEVGRKGGRRVSEGRREDKGGRKERKKGMEKREIVMKGAPGLHSSHLYLMSQ